MKTAQIRDTVTGCEFTIYLAEGETVEQRLADPAITNKCELIEAEPAIVGADRNIIIETEVQPDAVTEKQVVLIEQELMILPVARTNRRAVVKSITLGGVVRVSLQVWQRITPAAHENAVGDMYRWVELKSVRL